MDAEAQAIFVARGDLARLQHPARPAFEAQQRGDIIIEAAARNMRRQFGAERFDREPRNMFGELKGVRPDVADAAAEPGARGDGKSTRLNSSHQRASRIPSSAWK